MLTSRNIILTIISIAVLSILLAIVSLILSNRHSPLNRDFYGIKGEGYRAVFDLLEAFDIPVERAMLPYNSSPQDETTYVMWAPQSSIINIEPEYLKGIRKWVEDGGHMVFAFPKNDSKDLENLWRKDLRRFQKQVRLPNELGLNDIEVTVVSPENTTQKNLNPLGYDEVDDFRKIFKRDPVKFQSHQVKKEGEWKDTLNDVHSVKLPESNLQVLELNSTKPKNVLKVTTSDKEEHILAASFPVGQGSITVVSDPYIAQNRVIAKEDNSVLLIHLLASGGKQVLFDGFYHGLMVRGNPLWLYTLPGYGAVTFALLLIIGLWMWRESQLLGPPLETRQESRRTIVEYITSMGVLFNRSKSVNPFFLKTIRDGAIRSLRAELNIKPSKDSLQKIIAVLSRKDPKRCEQFKNSIEEIERLLLSRPKNKDVITAIRKVISCL